jgi:signal transduction histidine kinase
MRDDAPAKDASARSQVGASFAELADRRRGRLRRYLYRRPRVMDAVVVLCYLLLAAPTAVDSMLDGDWAAAGLLAGIAVALVFRRSHPVAVVAAVAVLEVAITLLHPWGANVSAGLWFALYALALQRSRRFTITALALSNAPLSLLYFLTLVGPLERALPNGGPAAPENSQLVFGIVAGITITLSNIIATGIGISVRQRREHEQEIAAWAARTAELGSVTERNRIAREMHDVVAHSLTVMLTLSDGAAVVVRKSPDRAAEVLGELSRTGRTALADMRRVLGVLRDESPTGLAPRQPLSAGLSLAKLLEGFRTAGLPLHYSHTGPALPEDAAFQLTVYRIVQESLTNVLRYGRALGRVDVSMVRSDGTVTIEVLDDGKGSVGTGPAGAGSAGGPEAGAGGARPAGTGQGLTGMRERAGIYGGTVEAGRTASGGWRVSAVLNWNGDQEKT